MTRIVTHTKESREVTIDQEQLREHQVFAWSDDDKALFIHRLTVPWQSRNLGIASKFQVFACQSS